jgi:hypothetical protein
MSFKWQFVCAPAAGDRAIPWAWRWKVHAPGGATRASPDSFPTLEECIAHARVCGYNPRAGDITNLVDPRTCGLS